MAGTEMNDFPRRDHFDSDARVTAHHGVTAEDCGELRLVLDAVLQSQNRAARLEASGDGLRGGFGVVGFYAEQDQIVRRELARRVGCGDFDAQIAADAGDVEALIANRTQIFAAPTQHDVLAGSS